MILKRLWWNMAEWLITGLTEIEIRGTDNVPVYVYQPRWSITEAKYPNFTSVVHSGKTRLTHPFRSDDVEITLDIMNDGGEEKEVAKALATNVAFVYPLMKHCKKLANRIEKAKKRNVIVKKSLTKKSQSYTKNEISDTLKVDLNIDTTIKLKNWM